MSGESHTESFEQPMKAAPEQVYYAFTNATALREWLCDIASVAPRVGGRVYLYWNSGFYTAGEYMSLDPGKCVDFTWYGRGEPGATQVNVTLEPEEAGTRVRLEHTGFGNGAEWQKAIQESREGWKMGLENLASVLETGQDMRFTRRPMMGISMSDFSPEVAAQLGVPVTEGLRLDGTLNGMGAQKAGLQQNDVITAMDGQPVTSFTSLPPILQKRRSGDVIEVEFYRGPEKKKVNMELSQRPLPEISFEPKELASQARKIYDQTNAELARLFEGVMDEEASRRPAPDQWSALEVVAHLLLGERFNSLNLVELVGGYERWADDFAPNSLEETRAVVSAYPTIAELLEEYRRTQAITLALIETLPPEFTARKGSYWRQAYGMLANPGLHEEVHYAQIRAAIQAARQ